MTIQACPECHGDTDTRGLVRIEVTLSAGDETAGSSSTACVSICGDCARALSLKYTTMAVETQQALARSAASAER